MQRERMTTTANVPNRNVPMQRTSTSTRKRVGGGYVIQPQTGTSAPRAIQQRVNSVTRAAPIAVNRPRLSDYNQLKEENEQLLRLLNEKSAQLEGAMFEIGGLNSKVVELETQLENNQKSTAEKATEIQHASESCATKVSELEILSRELQENLELKESQLEDAEIAISQLESTLEFKSTQICTLQDVLEKCVSDVIELETLSEELIETLESKAAELEDAKKTICTVGSSGNRLNTGIDAVECPSATPKTDDRRIIQDLLQDLGSLTTQLHEAQDQISKLEAELQVFGRRPENRYGNTAHFSTAEPEVDGSEKALLEKVNQDLLQALERKMRQYYEAQDQGRDLKAEVEDLKNRLQKNFPDVAKSRDKL